MEYNYCIKFLVVNRKSLSAEFLQKLSAETLSVSAEMKSSVSPFLQKELLSAENSLNLDKVKEKFLPKYLQK